MAKPNPFAAKAGAKPAPGKGAKPGDKKLPPWLKPKTGPAMKSGGKVKGC